MRSLSAVVLGAVAAFGVACGGSNPGGGTKTLYVQAEARSDGSTEGTWFAVHIREGHNDGPVVDNAVVTIRGDHTGEFTLPWEGFTFFQWPVGVYVRGNMPWDTGWAINVRRGADGLDAYLHAPGITEITEPIANTTFRRVDGEPLMVQWRDDAGHRAEAVNVDFEQSDYVRQLSEDPLQLQVDRNDLVGTDSERVEVTRTTAVDLAGGTPGSVFTATTQHAIRFRVE
jgi:hypothetical protein